MLACLECERTWGWGQGPESCSAQGKAVRVGDHGWWQGSSEISWGQRWKTISSHQGMHVCVCVCACVCVHVCMYLCMCTCVHPCVCTCACAYMCACICARVCLCMCVHVCMYLSLCVHVCICACVHVHVCTCVYVSVHVCVYTCMCVCTCMPTLLSAFSLMLLHLSTSFNLQSIFTCYILGDPQREPLKKLFFFSPLCRWANWGPVWGRTLSGSPSRAGRVQNFFIIWQLMPQSLLLSWRCPASQSRRGFSALSWAPRLVPRASSLVGCLKFQPISQVPRLPLAPLFSELGATPSSLEIESFSTRVTAVFKRRA